MNQSATKRLGRQIANRLQQSNGGVVLLDGPMGAGKTTLVRAIMQTLAPDVPACSPTYTLINQYTDCIYHADLYRLENPAAVTDTGLVDLCVPGNYVFVEWPRDFTVPGALRINIQIKENGDREFIVIG